MQNRRTAVRDLAERLVVEYAGAIPAGQVLAIVFRTAGRLAGVRDLSPDAWLDTCEVAVRRALADRRVAAHGRPPHAA